MTESDTGGKAIGPGTRWRRWVGNLVTAAVAMFLLAVVLYPLFPRRRDGPSPTSHCLSNVKLLAVAVNMYLTDYDAPPDPRRWCDQTLEYVRTKKPYKCSEAAELACGYALNTGVEGARAEDVSGPGGKAVTLSESDVGWNAHGGRELLPAEPRHLGGDNYGLLEGSAKWVKREGAEGLRWEVGEPTSAEETGGGKQ